MPTPRGLTAREIASLVGGEVEGPDDAKLAGIAPLDRAGPGELSFLASSRYLPYFQRTSAGAVLLGPPFRAAQGGPATRIVVNDPHRALARVLPEFYPEASNPWGVDPEAQVGRGTRWTGRIALAAGARVGRNVVLGADCRVDAGAVLEDDCHLGARCHVEAHAVIHRGSVLGDGVRVRAGARVGGPGFGFIQVEGDHQRIPQVGGCVLGNNVEVGANSTVDRGSVGDTVVGDGTKIDNLVHIGHNVRVGSRCLVMAQVGIAGSSVLEDDVWVAGQAGLADHLRVGRGARIGAQAGVIGDIERGTTVSGYPARPHREVLRQVAAMRRLAPLTERLEDLVGHHDG